MATRISGACRWAALTPATTTSVVGFSCRPPKRCVSIPARARAAIPLAVCPAEITPGSLTTSARRAPISEASSPSVSIFPGPNTIRVRGWKSKGDMRKNDEIRMTNDEWGVLQSELGIHDCLFIRHSEFEFRHFFLRRLQRPVPEQEVNDVPFVRLQPIEAGGGEGAEVQAVDVGCFDALGSEFLVATDDGADEGGTNLRKHVVLWTLHDRAEWEHVFLLRDSRFRRVAMDDGRTDVSAPLGFDETRAVLRREISDTALLQIRFDHSPHGLRLAGDGERSEATLRIGRWLDFDGA